jgi:hypothetical protein
VSPATRTPPRAVSAAPPPPAVVPSPIPAHSFRPPRPDTLAVVSAAALPRAAVWRPLAQRLPPGSVLLVTSSARLDAPLTSIVQAFQAHGRPVTLIALEQLTEQQLPLL